MPTVLVIASREDWPTDRVVKILTEDRCADVFRLDAEDFPQQLTLAGQISDQHGWTGRLSSTYRSLDLSEVTSCYYRTPNPFRFPEGMSGPERRFAMAQARAGLGGIIAALDCRWVSHPSDMSRAEYKPVQLSTARRSGLAIPETLVTNSSDELRQFADSIPGPIICKPIASPVLIENDELRTVFTRMLNEDDLADLRGIDTTAHMFQAWMAKQHEVRLTVIGDRMFAAEVHADSEAARIDWRSDYHSLTYETTDVPPHVAEGVRRLMSALNLRFGALDFIVSPMGEWTFLEVNPCGQWDWIQHATGHPIAEAIADELQGVTP